MWVLSLSFASHSIVSERGVFIDEYTMYVDSSSSPLSLHKCACVSQISCVRGVCGLSRDPLISLSLMASINSLSLVISPQSSPVSLLYRRYESRRGNSASMRGVSRSDMLGYHNVLTFINFYIIRYILRSQVCQYLGSSTYLYLQIACARRYTRSSSHSESELVPQHVFSFKPMM